MRTLRALVLLAMLAQMGCAGFSKDGGFEEVARQSRAQLGKDVKWPRTGQEQAERDADVKRLLSARLSADEAVQVALLNNRTLQAGFEELGVSEARLMQSGRLPNPRFDLRHAAAGGQYDIEETVSFNVLSLLTLPYAHGLEQRRFTRTQEAVVLQIMQLARETREAYYTAVAAHEALAYALQVNTAGQTGALLAQRMVAAGHWSPLDESHEQIFQSDAARALTRARLDEAVARERLLRLLGLADDNMSASPLTLAEHLPDAPPSIAPPPDIDARALQDRVDLRLMRQQVDELAGRLKLTRATRFIDVLEAGPARVKQGRQEQPYETGFIISFEVPIFDGGAARVRQSEALYAQAVDRFAQACIDARSQIREAYAAYQARFEQLRRQHDAVIPLRQAVVSQNLLRYNASLISIFDLLSDARAEAESIDEYIADLRDFWIAQSQLDAALAGDAT